MKITLKLSKGERSIEKMERYNLNVESSFGISDILNFKLFLYKYLIN